MHPKQREIIDLINDYKLADAFAALDKQVLNNAVYSQLKKTYLTGKTDVDFIDRLLVFVQNLDLKENPAMPDHKAHLKKLIRIGRIGDAIEELCDATEQNGQKSLNNNLLNLSGRYYRAEASKRQGIITDASYNTQIARLQDSLGYYIEEYEPSGDFAFKHLEPKQPSIASPAPPPPAPAMTAKIFISYSTQDRKIANMIKARLEAEGMLVTIDYQDFLIGEDLMKSIEDHLKANDIVLSLVSTNSLQSKWVAKESVIMFYTERLTDKLFIPAFLDDFVFKRSFVSTALKEIHQEINDIRQEINDRTQQKMPIDDLSDELSFYEQLGANLPNIVKRFRARLAVNLTPEKLEEGIELIINRIKAISA